MSPRKHSEDEEVVDIDAGNTDEDRTGDIETALVKIAKLKAELAACKSEKQEYLDGWQRLRADVANSKKTEQERASRGIQSAKEAVVSDLIPIMDNFDMARTGSGWQQVDPTWRTGVEAIISQLEQLLGSYGATRIGSVGEMFNPHVHEAVREVAPENGQKNGEVVAILRSGWRIEDRVLRPAQITLAHTD